MAKKTATLDPLIGRKVKALRRLTKAELDSQGWERDRTASAIEFDDGTVVFASSDDEGNGPGALFGIDDQGNGFYI